MVKFVKEHRGGALEYTVAKKSIRVNKPIVLTDEELKMTDDELMAWMSEQNAKAAQHRTYLKAEQEEIVKAAYLAGIEQLLPTVNPATLDRVWAILSSEALQRLQQH